MLVFMVIKPGGKQIKKMYFSLNLPFPDCVWQGIIRFA